MNEPTSTQQVFALLSISSVCLVVAFALLPWMATLPAVQGRIEFNNERKIDGGATFYTDHDFMTDLLMARECGQQ